MKTERVTRDYIAALGRVCERVQRWCRSCNTTHYASLLTPVLCPICESEDVEVRG